MDRLVKSCDDSILASLWQSFAVETKEKVYRFRISKKFIADFAHAYKEIKKDL